MGGIYIECCNEQYESETIQKEWVEGEDAMYAYNRVSEL